MKTKKNESRIHGKSITPEQLREIVIEMLTSPHLGNIIKADPSPSVVDTVIYKLALASDDEIMENYEYGKSLAKNLPDDPVAAERICIESHVDALYKFTEMQMVMWEQLSKN
jgi:hypothetical protein